VTVHLDTSALISSLTGTQSHLDHLESFLNDRHRLALSSIALYEWLRGPRKHAELVAQEALLPRESIVAFDAAEALVAADLYKKVSQPRGREIDLAIAACAIAHGASLWTLNPDDFRDIPGLRLV